MTLEEKVIWLLEQRQTTQQAKASKKFYLVASFVVMFGGLFATYRLIGLPQGTGIFAASSGTPEDIQITQVGVHTFTIVWKTGVDATGYIKYGPSVDNKDKTAFDDKALSGDKRAYTTTNHQITVSNAEANQLYFYMIISRDQEYSASDGSIFTPIKTLAQDDPNATDQVTLPVKSGFADLLKK